MKDLVGQPLEVAQELAKLDRQTQFKVLEAVLGDHSVCKSFLGATGRLPVPVESTEPEPKTGPDRAGIQYVFGAPPPHPSLKPVHHPLIDTEIFPAREPMTKTTLFVDRSKFADGRYKTPADTNMFQHGSLGYPLEFDLRWLELHLSSEDPVFPAMLLPHMAVSFFFGCNTPWLRIPAGAWRPLISLPDGKFTFTQEERDAFVRSLVDTLHERKACWGHYWHPVGDAPGPRRISSTESFRVEIEFLNGIVLDKAVRIQMAMQNVLYTHR